MTAEATHENHSIEPRIARASDGGDLAYTDNGGAGIALITPLSYRTTLAGLATAESQRSFLEAIGSGHQLIIYDQRGVGYSHSATPPESWEQRGSDLWAVADAAGVERAVLYAVFDAGYTIAQAAAQQPERVLGLVFNFVPPVFLARPDFPYGLSPERIEEAYGAKVRADHARQVQAVRNVGINDADAEALVTAWEQSVSPDVLDRLQQLLRAADLREVAPRLRMRSLVIEPQRRPLISGWGKVLAELLPNSRLVYPANTGEMLGAVQGFLTVVQIDEGVFASRLSPLHSLEAREAQRSVASLCRIVVPVVDTVSSERAAEMACRLGESQQAEIVLVHILEVPLTRSLDDIDPGQRDRGMKALNLGQAIVSQHGLKGRVRLLADRSAASGILRAAREEAADMIVMAMGEKRSRDPSQTGKTMQEVLRRAPCEVLIDQSHSVRSEPARS